MGLPASYGRFEQEYCILKELGSGGEGNVYLVRHQATEQLRAAKRLWRKTDTDRWHELNMMKRLKHPSLPEVIDVLAEKDGIWLIMTYVRGQCLQGLFSGGISEAEFFSIAGQLAEVLGYLHGRRMPILHLDIKPTNLLLKKNGRLVLIDFGAALYGQPGVRPERCCGTPGFAAPEQYQKGAYLDARTDVYGAGAVLYYLLYGSIPDGTMGEVDASPVLLDRSVQKDSWKKRAGRLIAVCMKAEPSERYADGTQMALALHGLQKKSVRRKQQKRLIRFAALGLAILTLGTMLLRRERGTMEEQRNQEYVRLLEQAERGGFEQADDCYREAASIYPERQELYTSLLERIMQNCQMDKGEERLLQELLYASSSDGTCTVKEALAKDAAAYGDLACHIGLAYWYFYEDGGGRTAAASWFREAVQSVEGAGEQPEWLPSAKLYQRIAGYYEGIGKENPNGDGADYAMLFQDLSRLWEEEGFQKESAQIRAQAAKELLACVIMEAAELKQGGVTQEKLSGILKEIDRLSEETALSSGQRKTLRTQCEAAQAAIGRVYREQTEGGREE